MVRRSVMWDWSHWAWGKTVTTDEWGDVTTIWRYGPKAIIEVVHCSCESCAAFFEKATSAELDHRVEGEDDEHGQ